MRLTRHIVVLAAAAAIAVSAAPARAVDVGVVGPDEKWCGQTLAQWTANWWRWAMAFPADQSPMTDTTGASLQVGQTGPVWFLTGTTGLLEPITRTVTVPEGKSLLIPTTNYLNDYDPYNPENPYGPGPLPPGTSLEEWLTPFAAFVIDHVTIREVAVNGVPVTTYRATTNAFTFQADPTMVVLDPVVNPDGLPQPGVSDGYWALIKPLPAGTYTITTKGEALFPEWSRNKNKPFAFASDVTYTLIVKPAR